MLQDLNILLGPSFRETLDVKLVDGGKNLSENQRLMLQFARAFLTRKKIILIDDVLMNLTPENRSIIIQKLNTLREIGRAHV